MSTNAPTTPINSLIKGKIIQGTAIVALLTATVAGLNAISPLYNGNTLPSLTGVFYVFISAFIAETMHITFDYYHGLPSNVVEGSLLYQETPLRGPVVIHNYPPPLTPTITVHNHPIVPTTDTGRKNYEVTNTTTPTEEKTTMTTSPLSLEAKVKNGEEDTLKMAFPKKEVEENGRANE